MWSWRSVQQNTLTGGLKELKLWIRNTKGNNKYRFKKRRNKTRADWTQERNWSKNKIMWDIKIKLQGEQSRID